MFILIFSAAIFNALATSGQSSYKKFEPPADPSLYNKTTPELAARDGYPLEVHYITTSDGYILGTHRIPYSNVSGLSTRPKPVVILHHGIAASSSCWLINSPGKRLPYMLADAGYDVWLVNSRGNMYSRNHTHFDPEKKTPFWDFSLQELALFDLPADIDYIKRETGVKKVSYIGYSLGTTVFFILTSTIPSYNEKFTVSIALSPVTFSSHMICPIALLHAPTVKIPGPPTEFAANFLSLGTGQYAPNDHRIQRVPVKFCHSAMSIYAICSLPAYILFGFNPLQLNASIVYDIWGHIPQGSGIYLFVHFGQFINTGTFRMFDYGIEKNREVYQADEPPDIALENVSTPLYIFAGSNDLVSNLKDVAILRSKLTGVNETYIQVEHPLFCHLDFLTAIDANLYINFPIMKILHDHNGMGQ